MKKIVYATRNQSIMEELNPVIPGDINLISLKDLPETSGLMGFKPHGKTFLENATTRAKYWEKILKMPIIAEEIGVTIDALYGFPGIHTKRVEDEVGITIASDYYPNLIKMMKQSKVKSTSASWICAMVFSNKGKTLYCVESLDGDMCERTGERKNEFEYFFKPKGYNTTLSEISFEEKCELSPRNRALKQIIVKAFR